MAALGKAREGIEWVHLVAQAAMPIVYLGWGTCRVQDPPTLFEVMQLYLEAVEVEIHGAEANC